MSRSISESGATSAIRGEGGGDVGETTWPGGDLAPARDPDPLIPEGDYDGHAVKGEVRPSVGGRRTCFLTMEIIGGQYDGTRLPFIAKLPPPQRGISPASKYYRAWVTANGGRKPARKDRMATGVFKNRLLRLKVRTVKTDHSQRPLAQEHWYSVVDILCGA